MGQELPPQLVDRATTAIGASVLVLTRLTARVLRLGARDSDRNSLAGRNSRKSHRSSWTGPPPPSGRHSREVNLGAGAVGARTSSHISSGSSNSSVSSELG